MAVTIIVHNDDLAHPIYEVRCLSTEKPTANIPNGSTCIEIDTGKVYMYDIDSDQWNEI